MACDCEGIRRALISPVANTTQTTAITSGVVDDGKVIGSGELSCVSLCNACVARIKQAKIVEYSAATLSLIKGTLDLYLFNTEIYTATLNGTLSLSAEADWDKLVGIIPFNQSDYKRVLPAGSGYIAYAYADFNFAKGYLKQVKTNVTKTLYGVLVNESGQQFDYGSNNIYVELTMEK